MFLFLLLLLLLFNDKEEGVVEGDCYSILTHGHIHVSMEIYIRKKKSGFDHESEEECIYVYCPFECCVCWDDMYIHIYRYICKSIPCLRV